MPTTLRSFSSAESQAGHPHAFVRERAREADAGGELFKVCGTEVRRLREGKGWRLAGRDFGVVEVIEYSREECDALESRGRAE